MNAQTSYQPGGPWRAAVTPDAILVLGSEVPIEAVRRAWQTLAGGGIAAVLDALTGAFGTSLTAIPPFALAVREGDGLRIAVRGTLAFEVVTAGGTEVVTGAGTATWVERLLPDVIAFAFSPEGGDVAPADELSVRDGVVLAAGLRTVLREGAFDDVARATDEHAEGSAGAAIGDEDATDAPENASAADADTDTESASEQVRAEEPTVPAAQGSDAAERDAPGAAPALAEDPDPATSTNVSAGDGDDIVDPEATVAPAPEPQPEHHDVPSMTQTWHPVSTVASGSESSPVEEIEDTANAETIIRPKSKKVAPSEVPTDTPDEEQLGDHDGHTIAVAPSRRRTSSRDTLESTARPSRPASVRGRLRLSNGTVADIQGTVVIGRRPRAVRSSANELPLLITVDSPQQDISRSHLEIRVEGDHVLATDLQTTNGTVLHRGAQEPVRLHPSEATMIVAGDLLDLGDGVTVTFEGVG